MKASDFDPPSVFIKADELIGKRPTLTVLEGKSVETKNFKTNEPEQSLGVSFAESPERVWLPNFVCRHQMIEAWGDETDSWKGQKIELYTSKMPVAGKIRDVICCEPVVSTVEQEATDPTPDPNKDIPF